MSATVCVPVTDLRRSPVTAKPGYERDFLQESQLLYGEKITVLEEKNGWCRIEAVQQPKYISDMGWRGYPGWVDSSHIQFACYPANCVIQSFWANVFEKPDERSEIIYRLPFGAQCRAELMKNHAWQKIVLCDGKEGYVRKEMHRTLLQKAVLFIGHPYLWGGCSPFFSHANNPNTSVDCSGLIHLIYRSSGIIIPRDANDQFLFSEKTVAMEPGNLLFSADFKNPQKIDHVMLVGAGENLIEACLDANEVRQITFSQKFGASFNSSNANIFGNSYIRLGCIPESNISS